MGPVRMKAPSGRTNARVVLFLLVALLLVDLLVWGLGQTLASVVVPGWVKGPLIDPAAPYAPENAVVLFAACLIGIIDMYGILLLVGRRALGARWWVAWGALAAAVGCVELAMRAYLQVEQITYFRPHPTLHWQVRPDLVKFPNASGGGAISTNEDGMRAVTEPREKAPDVYRILVLGDSSNFGQGVQDDEVWSSVLAGQLVDRVPGRRVEVLNGACPGWTTYQALDFMAEIGDSYHPDLVLAGFNNDPGPEYLGDRQRLPAAPIQAAEHLLFRMETYLLAREFVLSTLRRFAAPPEIHYIARNAGEKPTYGKLGESEAVGLVPRVPEEEFLANVRRLWEDGAVNGYGFAWINMPINRAEPELVERYVNPRYRADLAEVAEREGIPVIDVDDAWVRSREPELHIIGHVFHPSARGHRRFAEQVAQALVSRALLPGAVGDVPVGGPPLAATEATLRFGWSTLTPVHAHVGVVLEAHPELATAHGLSVELHGYASGGTQGDDVARGALDAFFTCEVPAVQMVGSRTDVRIVASPGSLGRVAVVARRGEASSLQDLRGKRVGVTPGATTAMDWAGWGEGLDAETVALKTDALEGALARGEVAAVVAWDPWVEQMLRDAPGGRVILAERSFRSDLAVSVPWATYEPGRARRLAALVADALRVAAQDRPRWDAAVSARSGWPIEVVRAVADRNPFLAGSAGASMDLTQEDVVGLGRALGYSRPPGLTMPTLLDVALLDGRVTARRYTPTAQFNAGPPRGNPTPDGPPRGGASPAAPPGLPSR